MLKVVPSKGPSMQRSTEAEVAEPKSSEVSNQVNLKLPQ